MIKTYISINYTHLTTNIIVEGLPIVIEFKGGTIYPRRVNGIFSTDDDSIQKSIESDSSYRIEFKLLDNCSNTNKNKIDEEKQPVFKDIKSVKNKQMAIEWLDNNLNIKTHPAMTYFQIKKVAYERGVTFSSITK